MNRALFVSCWLCLSLSGVLAVAQNSPNAAVEPLTKFLGSWKQLPGPEEPTTFSKTELEGSDIKLSFGCKQDSSCRSTITGNYDGKLYTYSDNANAQASFRKTGDRILQENMYFNGKQTSTEELRLSLDGNTLTDTSQAVASTKSKKVNYVYSRSGGPVSKDNPFIGFWKRDWNKSDAIVLTYAHQAGGYVVTDQNGVAHVRNCDGNDHTDSVMAPLRYSCHFTDENTVETLFKDENGKADSSLTTKVSEDGKKMTRLRKNAEGKTTSELIFEKTN